MIVFPFPPDVPSNRYLDLLYTSLAQHSDLAVRRLRPARRIPRELWRAGPRAILHLHWFDGLLQRRSLLMTGARSLGFLLALRLFQWRGARIVWTVHNLEPHETYHRRLARWVYRRVAGRVDAVIVHSRAAERLVRQHYGKPRRLFIIPHGNYIGVYGPEVEQHKARSRLGLPQTGPVLIALGALRPYKGYEMLLEAFAGLPPDQRGCLLIAGAPNDPAYGAEIQRRAAAVAGAEVRVGFVADEELPLYLGAADLVVLPYQRMLTSGMLLCALSYSRPVVAPDLPPIAEIVREGREGFLYPAGEIEELRQALWRALTHPALPSLRQTARAAAEPLSWARIAGWTAEVYQVISQGARSDEPAQ
ncbi:MAG: peptidase M14 [Herpetosiphonaceae bacterium]|nr:MAG: peptidase M14 [Herpetosiphonaceae bacterium]